MIPCSAPDTKCGTLLPIGNYYTMWLREAALAVRIMGVLHVIPMHYNTFPVLTGTPAELRQALQQLGMEGLVLLWLFQDLVLWLLQTNQIQTFRPRRN